MDNNIVTLNQLLNVSETIKENADLNNKVNQLIEECLFNRYDTINIKDKLLKLFADFKSARYLYDFPVEENISISPTYEVHASSSQRSTASQVENAVSRYLDKKIYTTDVYNSLIKVSYKLTDDEAVYMTNTFFTHIAEERIAEIIGISKTYLQKIKKSCLIKLWVELEKYCSEDD